MTQYAFKPEGVCSHKISFGIEDGKLHDVKFDGGCPGNLQAIGKLIEGKDAGEIAALLKGNQCGRRGTSCADQLSIALEKALAREQETVGAQ